METTAVFSHRRWHHLLYWSLLAFLLSLILILGYAAAYSPPAHMTGWILLVALWAAVCFIFNFYFRRRQALDFTFTATATGMKLKTPDDRELFFAWQDIAEVTKTSGLTGFGFVRVGTPAAVYFFCNWIGEANGFVDYSISQCLLSERKK